MVEYPTQIFREIQEKMVLAVDALYDTPHMSKESTDSPLEAPGYSRCKITIIDKTGNRVIYPYANIPENDIYYLEQMTKHAIGMQLDAQRPANAELSADIRSDAFTQRFPYGIFKRKTPAEVLLERPDNLEKLLALQKQLENGSGKFAVNASLLKGISQALQLYEEGNLAPLSTSPILMIYDEKDKFLKSNRDEDGRCMVYDISMFLSTESELPYTVKIRNYYAHLVESSTGSIEVIHTSAVEEVEASMAMTAKRFITMINKMFYTMRDFNTVNFARRYKLAMDLRKKASEAAKAVKAAADSEGESA